MTYPHPSLEPILKRTLGVPLFQEQLLRIAMVAAGFTGGEAEELRRAMGFKRSEKRMRSLEARLREGMTRNGIVGEAQEQVIRQVVSFALYGFPESHAASFALIAYASAFLKCYQPAAFVCALLNNQPMGFYHPATLVKDGQRHGVRFLFEAGPEHAHKKRWLAAWKRHTRQLVPVLRRAKGLGWFKDEHDDVPAAILTDLPADAVARLGDELLRTRDGQFVLGRAVSAEEAARWKPRDYARAARETFHLLAPLYRLR